MTTTQKARAPSVRQLEQWMSDGGCETPDGCWVEPDGTCEHEQQFLDAAPGADLT